jgi:hypothetical protein
MRLASSRITPLDEKDWSPDARAERGRLAEAGPVSNARAAGPRAARPWGQYNLVSMAPHTPSVQRDAGLEGFARWQR